VFRSYQLRVQVLGHESELDNQAAGQVLGLYFAALFVPEPDQGSLVVSHNDSGVRSAEKAAPVR
jgi:hypothetical protein